MMLAYGRGDTSIIGRWWFTLDRWSLVALLILIGFGGVLTLAASPAVAERIGLGTFSLAHQQLLILPAACGALLAASLLTPTWVRRLGVVGLAVCMVLLLLTLVFGDTFKGATRWINILGFSLQPSELLKPAFVITAAWMLAAGKEEAWFPGQTIAIGLFLLAAGLLMLQPDLGQTLLLSAVFGIQLFLAGLPIAAVAILGAGAVTAMVSAYFMFPHVRNRIDSFVDPEAGDRYQIDRSLEAFRSGGLFGQGPGEGTVKHFLPDAHADFVFAVAGEEFGLLACAVIVLLFAFVVLRGFGQLLQQDNLFVLLAAGGLLAQFGLQALINMGSALHLIPTKGMTLPFLSYGGTSLLATAGGMGLLLALTRKRPPQEEA